jgi:SAM-dependent methyltransferase
VRKGFRAPPAASAPSPATAPARGSAGAQSGTPARGRRRSFSQRNLALAHEGPQGALLGRALAVPAEEGYALTHAFHPYPGRFHHALPRTLLEAAAPPGTRVLDPFMGGGTALVEALLRGLPAIGNDLNPIAVRVARERTRPRTPEQARALEGEARGIAARVEALRREKRPPVMPRRHQHRLAALYQPHLLAELMQWIHAVEALPAGEVRETLQAVFSSAVVRFSNLASDSRAAPATPPRYPKGAVTRFLLRKCNELSAAQVALAGRIAPDAPLPRLLMEDARRLPSLGRQACDLVLTSPPYPGTYDYHAQHRLRMDWLELDDAPLAAGEIGPRRAAGDDDTPDAAAEAATPDTWSAALRDVLSTLARVLRPGGALFLVMGDWLAGDHPVDAARALSRLADPAGWRLDSRASLRREAFSRPEKRAYARRGKWEHLLLFVRSGDPAAPLPPPAAPQEKPPPRPRQPPSRRPPRLG